MNNGNDFNIFENFESNVRYYCRDFPALFVRAKGHHMYDVNGKEYVDFLSGAGALNYGHNNKNIKDKVLSYLENDGVIHSLDMYTSAKKKFLEKFYRIILNPRNLDYKVQFTGPTGTNSIEAALKLARKITNRENIIAFTNAFHGMTLGSISATAIKNGRARVGVSLNNTIRMPFDGYFDSIDSLELMEKMFEDEGSGLELPAAILLETIQAEGGLNLASTKWLKGIARICSRFNILLIVDDIQAGIGRVGTFFSFERAKIVPDMVCLSKSISGIGLPLALVLLKPELDIWKPGEHNGTFRGNNLALIAAEAALEYWETRDFEIGLHNKEIFINKKILEIVERSRISHEAIPKGMGLIQGIKWKDTSIAKAIVSDAFQHGLIIETCGAKSDVLKIMPPLTIDIDGLKQGFKILDESVNNVIGCTNTVSYAN